MQTEFARTPEVQDWQWRIAATMREGVEKSFATRPDEVDCIKAIVDAISATEPVTVPLHNTDSFTLEVESAFLHGSKSQVRFSIGGKQHQRELADLLVLATYVEDGTLAFQRACFIQAKRCGSTSGRAAARFGIDPWQLALLGSFPKFTGLSGLLKGKTHQLRNRSGMLGAYGFLSQPGNFTVVSARVLNHLLGGRKSLTTKELIPAILSEAGAARSAGISRHADWWFDPEHCPECHEMAMHFFPSRCRHHHGHHSSLHARGSETPLESVLTCVGLDEFVQSWSGLRLGEVWHAKSHTKSDLALRACMCGIVSRVVQSTSALSGLQQVLKNIVERVEHNEEEMPALGILSIVGTVKAAARAN